MLRFKMHDEGDFRILTPDSERIDASNALAFRDACRSRLPPDSRVILDLSAVRFIDSSGLGALVSLLKHFTKGGEIRLVVPHPSVRALFEVTRLDQVLSVHPSSELAAA